MTKPWIGYLAVACIFIAGVIEWLEGYVKLGILLILVSIVSLCFRLYLSRKHSGK
jgi:hypothetical protein